MEFIWLWVFSLKTPMTWICGVAIAACFINFLSAKSSGRYSDSKSLFVNLHVAIAIAVIWSLIYSVPSPTYNMKTVYKEKIVEKPVVKKHIHIARTITQIRPSSYEQKFKYCTDKYANIDIDTMNKCKDFARQFLKPRVVTKTVVKHVPVYKGERIVPPARDARVAYCLRKRDEDQDGRNASETLRECTDWAIKMELPQQVRVRVVHDSYQKLFDKCNSTGRIPPAKDGETSGASVRNERIKYCGELALKASQDH